MEELEQLEKLGPIGFLVAAAGWGLREWMRSRSTSQETPLTSLEELKNDLASLASLLGNLTTLCEKLLLLAELQSRKSEPARSDFSSVQAQQLAKVERDVGLLLERARGTLG